MIRILLFSLLCVTIGYGQDTLAIVQPEKKVGYPEISFVGDTMLVRFVFDANRSALISGARWYTLSGKIGDVDASALGELGIMGIVNHKDSLFYYSVKAKKKTEEILVCNSIGMNTIRMDTSIPVIGEVIKGIKYKNQFLIITWDQRNQLVYFYKIDGNRLVSEQKLQLDRELLPFPTEKIGFIVPGEPLRIGVTKTTLRFFLNGDTFAAVYDMPGTLYPQEVAKYKTRVVRFNLSTGETSDKSIYSYKTFAFKSFLVGNNLLYRLSISKDSCKINVHDLDKTKTFVSSYPVPFVDKREKVAIRRLGVDDTIELAEMSKMQGIHARPNYDIGIMVDEYNGEQVISVGTINNAQGMMGPGGSAFFVAGVATMIAGSVIQQSLTPDPDRLRYIYLKGTRENGYKLVSPSELNTIPKGRLDNFELDAWSRGKVNYIAHFMNKDYSISVTGYTKKPTYTFTILPLNP